MAREDLTASTEEWGGINNTGIHHGRIPVHSTFFWGHDTQVLFRGWPGHDPGMYAIALIFVFFLALLVEYLSHTNFIKPGTTRASAGLFQTVIYTVRNGVAYMVMLAVMSFNGGVFLAALGGHAIGFLIFRSRVFSKHGGLDSDKKFSDVPPM